MEQGMHVFEGHVTALCFAMWTTYQDRITFQIPAIQEEEGLVCLVGVRASLF